MAPLFSKVDINKLWHDVQNEETFICAKFGKDLFNISKVIGRKKWPSFFDSQCRVARSDIRFPKICGIFAIQNTISFVVCSPRLGQGSPLEMGISQLLSDAVASRH